MSPSRLDLLLKMQQENPSDAFVVYGLFLEYRKENKHEFAKKCLTELLHNHSTYLPTYYQAASFYIETGLLQEAMNMYDKGIDLAIENNDQHALKELHQAKGFLEEDMEE